VSFGEMTIGDNDPVTLELAVKLFFPHAGITKHTLMAEIARGRLEHERVGRKILVTRRQVELMRERCRVPAREPAPFLGSQLSGKPSMLLTERMKKALASAELTAKRLKSGSLNISPTDSRLPRRP
jgi:hypothetical protein